MCAGSECGATKQTHKYLSRIHCIKRERKLKTYEDKKKWTVIKCGLITKDAYANAHDGKIIFIISFFDFFPSTEKT